MIWKLFRYFFDTYCCLAFCSIFAPFWCLIVWGHKTGYWVRSLACFWPSSAILASSEPEGLYFGFQSHPCDVLKPCLQPETTLFGFRRPPQIERRMCQDAHLGEHLRKCQIPQALWAEWLRGKVLSPSIPLAPFSYPLPRTLHELSQNSSELQQWTLSVIWFSI